MHAQQAKETVSVILTEVLCYVLGRKHAVHHHTATFLVPETE